MEKKDFPRKKNNVRKRIEYYRLKKRKMNPGVQENGTEWFHQTGYTSSILLLRTMAWKALAWKERKSKTGERPYPRTRGAKCHRIQWGQIHIVTAVPA